MIEVQGLNSIKAIVVQDSVSKNGVRLITLLVDYPRIVHAEQLKHRMFSTSAASSRAIPFAKMAEQLTGRPMSFGKNQSGMQAGDEHTDPVNVLEACEFDFAGTYDLYTKEVCSYTAEEAWATAMESALGNSKAFAEAGYHKQVYNRLTEPFQMMRVLITATEWDNFFWLRNDKAADPTLQEVARVMQEAMNESVPQVLEAGEWHLPFVEVVNLEFLGQSRQSFYEGDPTVSFKLPLSLDEAIKVSAARCAAQSFRNTDYDLEKSLQVYDRLVNGDKIHGGALEHQATPMEPYDGSYLHVNDKMYPHTWQEGVSHADRNGDLWSGNFKQWIQHRKTLKGENYGVCLHTNI